MLYENYLYLFFNILYRIPSILLYHVTTEYINFSTEAIYEVFFVIFNKQVSQQTNAAGIIAKM